MKNIKSIEKNSGSKNDSKDKKKKRVNENKAVPENLDNTVKKSFELKKNDVD